MQFSRCSVKVVVWSCAVCHNYTRMEYHKRGYMRVDQNKNKRKRKRCQNVKKYSFCTLILSVRCVNLTLGNLQSRPQ